MGLVKLTVVVVVAGLPTRLCDVEVDVVKLPFPGLYTAVSVYVDAASWAATRVQVAVPPAPSVAVHSVAEPLLTVTVPDGVPPDELTAMLKLAAPSAPYVTGEVKLSVVVVDAAAITRLCDVDDVVKFALDALYTAAME